MIPKIIHYCWFGKSQYPPLEKKCILSWQKLLPDYSFKKWDESNSPLDIPYAKEAYQAGQWAFVSDYVRFWALYKEGGIYLDTDMFLLKNLDSLLENTCFLGVENPKTISCGIIGAEPGHWFIEECKCIYEKKVYHPGFPIIVPQLCTNLLSKYAFQEVQAVSRIKDITIYPSSFFYPLPFEKRREVPSSFKDYLDSGSIAIHLWSASWHTEWELIANGSYLKGFKRILKRIRHSPQQKFRYYLKSLYYLSGGYHLRLMMNYVKLSTLGWLARNAGMDVVFSNILPYPLKKEVIPQESFYPENTWKEIKKKGLKYWVNPGEHNGWRIFFNMFPRKTFQLFESINPDDLVLDVGANLGFFTLHFARKAFRGGVIAFEPFKPNFYVLKKNVELNQFSNIDLYNAGLGDREGQVEMESFGERNNGMVRVNEDGKGRETVPITTLDRFLEKQAIKKVNLIKVDIEGYELRFLKGARKTIEQHKPILFLELADSLLRNFGSTAEEVIFFLEELGYSCYQADTKEIISSSYYLHNCFFDILCLPDDTR